MRMWVIEETFPSINRRWLVGNLSRWVLCPVQQTLMWHWSVTFVALPLHPAYGESVHLGQQLRALCLETELEKRKKNSGVSMSSSVSLGKGHRVRSGYRIDGLVFSMFIVCMCTYVWWYCLWDNREYHCDVDNFFCFVDWFRFLELPNRSWVALFPLSP